MSFLLCQRTRQCPESVAIREIVVFKISGLKNVTVMSESFEKFSNMNFYDVFEYKSFFQTVIYGFFRIVIVALIN